MAFKIVVLFATLACASAGYVQPEHQHLSYAAAPVAHYSSAPAVSYSSITRHETPKLAVAKQVAYAEPAVHYAAPLTKTYAVHEPALKTVVSQPAYTKTVYAQEPAHVYAHAAPVVAAKTVSYAAPQVHYSHATPVVAAKTVSYAEPQVHYAHAAPVVAAKTVSYAAPQVHYQAPLLKNVEYTKTLAYAPVAKHYVSEPTYTKHVVAEPTYTKTLLAEPAYTKTTYVSQPTYTKTLVAEPQPLYQHSSPVYAHAAPVVAAKTLSYAPAAQVSHVSYADNSAHYAW
uniref:Uncharacterized protein n=1 Tax=Anopheles stephensi TaxID=30069 RepID=A0A182YRG3_ANOST